MSKNTKAAEVGRLRVALQQIAYPELGTGPGLYECVQIARAALKAEKADEVPK